MNDQDQVLPDGRVYVSAGSIVDVRQATDPPPDDFAGPTLATRGTIPSPKCYAGIVHNVERTDDPEPGRPRARARRRRR